MLPCGQMCSSRRRRTRRNSAPSLRRAEHTEEEENRNENFFGQYALRVATQCRPRGASDSPDCRSECGSVCESDGESCHSSHSDSDSDSSTPSAECEERKESEKDAAHQDEERREAPFPRIAGYDVLSEFKGGKLARVLRVRSWLDGACYAAKCFSRSAEGRGQFQTEVHALRALRGLRGVIQLDRAFRDKRHYYLITELAPRSLFDVVKRGALVEDSAAQITRALCKTFVHLHASSYVHRDLKLENVVVDAKGRPKLIDFADMAVVRDRDRYEELVGTAHYLAPERWRVHTGAEAKASEVWALAALAFEMVTGQRCFPGRDLAEVRSLAERGIWGFPRDVKLSRDCRDFICRGLTFDARRRPSMAHMLQHPWLN